MAVLEALNERSTGLVPTRSSKIDNPDPPTSGTAFFRSRYNVTLTAYLDDTFLVADAKELAWAVGIVSTTLTDLGFTIHGEKSVLVPTKKIQYLGVIIDSELMRVTARGQNVQFNR